MSNNPITPKITVGVLSPRNIIRRISVPTNGIGVRLRVAALMTRKPLKTLRINAKHKPKMTNRPEIDKTCEVAVSGSSSPIIVFRWLRTARNEKINKPRDSKFWELSDVLSLLDAVQIQSQQMSNRARQAMTVIKP